MKPKFSSLHLIDFAIINCRFNFTTITGNKQIVNVMNSYEIDLDYSITYTNEVYRVFTKTSINFGENILEGYSIFAEGVSIFNFNKSEELTKTEKQQFLQFSAVSIGLSCLRGFIADLTSSSPYGRYLMPTIDLAELNNQKTKLISIANKEEGKTTSSLNKTKKSATKPKITTSRRSINR